MPQSASGRPPTRRQPAGEQTRQKLLRAALESFSERPCAEVTVGDIARSAGVAHGLLSHHFNGKDGLFAEVVRETDRKLRDATRVPAEGSAAERLRHHFAAHLRFLADHENAAVNLVLCRAEATDVAWEAFESARREGRREDVDTLVGFFVTFLTGALRAAYEVTPTSVPWPEAPRPVSRLANECGIISGMRINSPGSKGTSATPPCSPSYSPHDA
ncbi:MAG: TetR family transcriptional regulator [Streptomyces sp.]|nr:TetR family transcriptional regulator [Streptomyces sp.]